MSYIRLAIESKLANVNVELAKAQEKLRIKEIELDINRNAVASLSTEKQELTAYLEAQNETNI